MPLVMCTNFKAELAQAMHCFTAPVALVADLIEDDSVLRNVSPLTDLCRGMALSGDGLPEGCTIVDLPAADTVVICPAPVATAVAASITARGDVFRIALIRYGASSNYDADTANYSELVANGDEASGAGLLREQ